ncbi:MAG: NTP transferase domain-containing protein [Acidobacteriaceae bacterium]|nr:NTP transferase domain-containing protein [Acidobacteriaceae bacterium]
MHAAMEGSKVRSGVSAVVLAGGMSTRMGTPKQLVCIQGKPLLETVLFTLRASRVDEIVIVLGHSADIIQQQIPLGGVKIVINELYRDGMGTSLRTGINSVGADADGALIVLADQPFVRPETIDRLIEEYQERKPQIVIPFYNGFRGNPVLLDRTVFAELAGLSGDIGCRAIFGSHAQGILKVPVDDCGVLQDLDTRADIARFEQTGPQRGWEAKPLENADLSGREVLEPHLVVVGQDALAVALTSIARLLGFTVTVVDPFACIDDVPGAARILRVLDFSLLPSAFETYVVVASRGRFDEEALEQAMKMSAAYIALVANKRRAQEIYASLESRGVSGEKLANIRAPAGIDIGAVTPEEIALSIMAEIAAKRRK